jgi:linoleoyl-CoA desaturase
MGTQQNLKLKFEHGKTPFYADLRRRVDAYFEETGKSKNDNAFMIFKSVFWGGGTIVIWSLMLFAGFDPWVAWGLSALFGFFMAGVGFNIGHDAIHGSYSKKKWVNDLMSWSFDLMGASSYTWSIAHNFLHHTYTNVPEKDDDIHQPLIHLYPQPEKRNVFHKGQHVYGILMYTLTSVNWLLKKDFKLILRDDPRTGKPAPKKEVLKMFAGKGLHALFLVVIPLALTDLTVGQWAVGYATFHAFAGFTLAIVFQCAHVVEGPEFPQPDENGVIHDGWAEHQLKTTANFGGGSALTTFITGGLDHQIEHHLFPKICHVHYRHIRGIVKECAEEYGLPYMENPTFLAAVASHLRTLKRNAQPGTTIESVALPKDSYAPTIPKARRASKAAA